ncbi:MAG: hypothetical protein FWG92_04170 [Leptospirales bacterium]|nr:hypothetical protein [Leptospirales bacterium]
MKKIGGLIIVFSIAVLAFAACGSSKIGGTVKGETFKSEGWVDDNTYRTTGVGVASPQYTNKVQRRQTARRAAIISAQYQVLEKFTGAKVEGAAGMQDFQLTGIAVAQEVQGAIRGGSVVSETYDDQENCEVIYQVQARGLRKMVQASDIR